jgi:hypothetical protein
MATMCRHIIKYVTTTYLHIPNCRAPYSSLQGWLSLRKWRHVENPIAAQSDKSFCFPYREGKSLRCSLTSVNGPNPEAAKPYELRFT